MNSTFHGMLEGQELDSMASPTHSGNEPHRIRENRFLGRGEGGLNLLKVGKL
jgi:hypothetical protein